MMKPLEKLANRLKKRMFRYTPSGFPDPGACGAFYDARVGLLSGDDMMILEYSGIEAQERLFERAVDLLPPSGDILDLGCGLGHLISYLDKSQLSYDKYHGIDVSARMIKEASRRHPDSSKCSFEVRDVLKDPFPSLSFDTGYILSVLGYPIGDDPGLSMMAIIANVFAACRTGIVFSHLARGRRQGLKFTTSPEILARRCNNELKAEVKIDDDGKDFTYLIALRHPQKPDQ
jgi:SAM-dependent methyltransferase